MFCFQCEETAGGQGCQGRAGVCGKTAEVATVQDQLTGALIGLARSANGGAPSAEAVRLMLEGLVTTATNVNFDEAALKALIGRVRAEKDKLGRGEDYDLAGLWTAAEDVRALKSLILLGLRGMAAYAVHARVLGRTDGEIDGFLPKALRALGDNGLGEEELISLVLETGQVNLKALELLDAANTGAYGVPQPTTVPLTLEPGPFIVVSGHDLHDLKLLLTQTDGKGLNIYTHGEMLPAHGYPELKKHPQLKGHFGTAWNNQRKEFEGLPGAVLFTANCLMPVKEDLRDRVFTTGQVGQSGLRHIGSDKDFSPVIKKALELGGYAKPHPRPGQNGGLELKTGFGHGAVLGVADQVIQAVKAGLIRRFYLVGGCDGAKPGRGYYSEFVKRAPADTVILTLGCGKFRFNDLNLGEIGGLPRLMDMGQCNDAYSAVKVALALAEAFGCGVNDLPLTLILSWYEQKAVCILLTLLHLGVKNIRLGPSLPAFVSPKVLGLLVEKFGLAPIGDPEADLRLTLGH